MTDGQHHGVVEADLMLRSPMRLARRTQNESSSMQQDSNNNTSSNALSDGTNQTIIPEYESRDAPVLLDGADGGDTSGPKKLFDPASGKYVEVTSNTHQPGSPQRSSGSGRGRGSSSGRGRSSGDRRSESTKQQQQQRVAPMLLVAPSTSGETTETTKTTETTTPVNDANGQPMSKLMEQLQRNRSEKERRQHQERDRQQQERADRRKKRQEERARRGPRTCGVKFTGDANSGYVNVDAWDVSSQANVTLQQILTASTTATSITSAPSTNSTTSTHSHITTTGTLPTAGIRPASSATAAATGGNMNTNTATTSPTNSNSNGSELLVVRSTSSSVWGQQHSSPNTSNTWEIGKPTSPGSNASPTSGTATSSNPYAAAFAVSLQQPFVRASTGNSCSDDPDGIVSSSTAVGNNSPRNEGSSSTRQAAALYANYMSTTSPTNETTSATTDVHNDSTPTTQWGQSAGGVNPSAMEFVPFSAPMESNNSPTMSPQFSAMKPADNAEFNVVSFPMSGRPLIGGAYDGGSDMATSRSLLRQQQQPAFQHLLHTSQQQTTLPANNTIESTDVRARNGGSGGKGGRRNKGKSRNKFHKGNGKGYRK
jgi:chitinase